MVPFNLADLELFAKVVEVGSISEAARLLGLPKPTASRNLVRLEELFGTPLLHRSTRKLRLSDAGELFLPRCLEVLRIMRETREVIEGAQETPRGGLRISAPVLLGQATLGALAASYCERYPSVHLEIELDNRKADLFAENIDVAIRIGTLGDSSLIAKKVAVAATHAYAAPSYLERNGVPKHPKELSVHSVLHMSRTGLQFHRIRGRGEVNLDVPSRVTANDAWLLCDAVSHGLGIGVLPTFVAEPLCTSGAVQRLFPDWEMEGVPIYAICLPQQSKNAKVRTFIDHLSVHVSAFFASSVTDGE